MGQFKIISGILCTKLEKTVPVKYVTSLVAVETLFSILISIKCK